MPKRHPLYKLDLRLVFRQSSDLGHRRKDATPDSCQMLKNFVCKWKQSELNGCNDKVLNEIENLKYIIITKGCLSGLPTGADTNRNERLYRHLKPLFSQTRLHLPMALALMTILLYQYNCHLFEKQTGTPHTFVYYQFRIYI